MTPFLIWQKRIAVLKIRQTLLYCKGNRSRAARMLGTHRYTLQQYIRWDEKRDEELARKASLSPPK